MHYVSRRQFLASAAATGVIGAASPLLISAAPALGAPAAAIRVGTRVIEVNGRPATVFGLTQSDGSHGLIADAGRDFLVRLENRIDQPTLIHWHGLTPPWRQDGVPDLSQAALAPGAAYDYAFALARPGTNWMHSHMGLQEQRLMAAPLIVRDPADAGVDLQEIVVLFHDFTFRDPAEVFAGLRGGGHGAESGAASTAPGVMRRMLDAIMPGRGMDHGAGQSGMGRGGMGGMDHGAMTSGSMAGGVHMNDVEYDAFLANDRTLADPEVFRVERGGRVRLRLINGAAATNFWIDLDRLEGRLVAVDGMPVAPIAGRRFEFAIAQRLDILLELPSSEGAWPVYAVREGERTRTGFVLVTRGSAVAKLADTAATSAAAVGTDLERRLRAAQPLSARPADRRHTVTITEAPDYVWMINGAVYGAHAPLYVREGERVEITFVDRTTMAHPMHLHGHHFQVVAVGGQRLAGALRDTVLVPARGSVTVAFDATNSGRWALHCHHLYHMAAGMMTTVEYQA